MEPLSRLRRVRSWLVKQLHVRSKRDAKDLVFKIMVAVAALASISPFFLVLVELLSLAVPVLAREGLSFFSTTPGPNLQGGILNAIVGTGCVVAIACAVGIPLSVLGAVYISEYSRPGLVRATVEFAADVLAGIPSIVFGAFGFVFLVVYMKIGMGMLAGGLTLAFMMIPTVLRTTQEALRQVPLSLREASLALGATKWTTTWMVTIRSALPGVITGVLLAVGRVMGETAPLIFTAGNSVSLPTTFTGPGSWIASMPFTVWAYISDPRSYLQEKAHATAFTLLVMVLLVDLLANYLSRKFTRRLA
ncbi:MAG: phosphate ABC transporter permease PstA [Candidatus Thorarchaeota archaeon]